MSVADTGYLLLVRFHVRIIRERVPDDDAVLSNPSDRRSHGIGRDQSPSGLASQCACLADRQFPGHAGIGENVHQPAWKEPEAFDVAVIGEDEPWRYNPASGRVYDVVLARLEPADG